MLIFIKLKILNNQVKSNKWNILLNTAVYNG